MEKRGEYLDIGRSAGLTGSIVENGDQIHTCCEPDDIETALQNILQNVITPIATQLPIGSRFFVQDEHSRTFFILRRIGATIPIIQRRGSIRTNAILKKGIRTSSIQTVVTALEIVHIALYHTILNMSSKGGLL